MRDVARAFDTVLHKGVIGQVYNIGTQKERSVLDVVGTIAKHLKVDTAKIKHVEDRAFNDQRCALEDPVQRSCAVLDAWCACDPEHAAPGRVHQHLNTLHAALPRAFAPQEERMLRGGDRSCVWQRKVAHGNCMPLRRYYICDKKLLALGWKEEETWEEGIGETIDWCALPLALAAPTRSVWVTLGACVRAGVLLRTQRDETSTSA